MNNTFICYEYDEVTPNIILTKEIQKLKDDLEVFKYTDIHNIKDVIFQEKITLLLEGLK